MLESRQIIDPLVVMIVAVSSTAVTTYLSICAIIWLHSQIETFDEDR